MRIQLHIVCASVNHFSVQCRSKLCSPMDCPIGRLWILLKVSLRWVTVCCSCFLFVGTVLVALANLSAAPFIWLQSSYRVFVTSPFSSAMQLSEYVFASVVCKRRKKQLPVVSYPQRLCIENPLIVLTAMAATPTRNRAAPETRTGEKRCETHAGRTHV